MRVLIFLILFVSNALASRDIAVFKIADDIYFASDLKQITSDLRSYHCAFPESSLFTMLNFSEIEKGHKLFDPTSKMTSKELLIENKLFFYQLRNYLKLRSYVKSNSVGENKETKNIRNLIKQTKCFAKNQSDQLIEEFVNIDLFLKSRQLQSKSDSGSTKELLLKTVDRQFTHEDFF